VLRSSLEQKLGKTAERLLELARGDDGREVMPDLEVKLL